MASENTTNLLSEKVAHVMNVLTSIGIQVRNVSPVDSLSHRIEFLQDETLFALYVSEIVVEIHAFLGGVSAKDSRVAALKDGSNLTNFHLLRDHILWLDPDKYGEIWFLLRRVEPTVLFDADHLTSAIRFAIKTRKNWWDNCQTFLEPSLSDLDSRLN